MKKQTHKIQIVNLPIWYCNLNCIARYKIVFDGTTVQKFYSKKEAIAVCKSLNSKQS